ncbi:MAG: PEP-CTERM sorting domain-containing protein [Terriglobales bacterium]
MKDRAIRYTRRRRRSWYRRRLRKRRLATTAILVTVIAAVCALNFVRILSSPSRTAHGLRGPSDLFAMRSYLNEELGFTPPHTSSHPRYVARIPGVYPYSVVPGGVRNANALREAAARDRAVARLYAHFDFEHARLERIRAAREVYVSYRIRDSIFWTRKKIRLPAGELLLTDGKIAARAKCGNQISEVAKPDISDEEPDQDVLDQPVALEPLGPPLPIRPGVAMDLPAGQPLAQAGAGGFTFPYAPITAGPPITICLKKDGQIDKHCGGHHKPPVIPEPGTIVLLGSGLALVGWRYRMRSASA